MVDKIELHQEYVARREEADRHPGNVDAVIRVANVCRDMGLREEAVMWYAKALELSPRHPYASRHVRALATDKELLGISNVAFDAPIPRGIEGGGEMLDMRELAVAVLARPFMHAGWQLFAEGTMVVTLLLAFLPEDWRLPAVAAAVALLLPGFLFPILHASGQGDEVPPLWPSFAHLWATVGKPGLLFAALVGPPVIILFIAPVWVQIPVGLAATAYAPMAVLLLAEGKQSVAAFNPVRVIREIRGRWKGYMMAEVWLAVVGICWGLSVIVTTGGMWIWNLIPAAALMYGLLSGAAVLGLLARMRPVE